MKVKTLLINKEAYLFLQDRLRRKRGGRLTPPIIKHLEKAFETFAFYINDKKLYEIDKYIFDEDIESIKKVLDKNNLYYEESENDIILL